MINSYKILQRTISEKISFSGIGLHSGKMCNVKLLPAAPDSGITFIRKDLQTNNIIPADYKHIYKSNLCTTLKANNSDAKVLTVEHLLAAIRGNKIDNVKIEIDSQEIPILDGSSREYDTIIKKIGTCEQKNSYKKFLIIKDKISIKSKNSFFLIEPCNYLQINCTVDFPSPIGKQTIKLGKSFSEIYHNVKNAKTFCYYEDIETMRKNNLAKGGSLDNAIVIKNNTIMNNDFDNQPDYFAKHKTLDILGDLSLMELNILGNITVYFPGHELNRLAMLEIFSDYSNFSIYQYNKKEDFTFHQNILTI